VRSAECGVGKARQLRIVVVRLKSISNFTDFDPFMLEPDVMLQYSDRPEDIEQTDMVIIPVRRIRYVIFSISRSFILTKASDVLIDGGRRLSASVEAIRCSGRAFMTRRELKAKPLYRRHWPSEHRDYFRAGKDDLLGGSRAECGIRSLRPELRPRVAE